VQAGWVGRKAACSQRADIPRYSGQRLFLIRQLILVLAAFWVSESFDPTRAGIVKRLNGHNTCASVLLPKTSDLSIEFSRFFELVVFVDVRTGNKRLFEQAVNLAQFPEDHNEENRDYEQQELNIHFTLFGYRGIVNAHAFYYASCSRSPKILRI
jgi:hypothetical protein